MSRENVEIVRAMFEQFARGDFSAWAELPDDAEFVTSPEVPDAGTYRGEAAIRWMTAWVESFEGLKIEATEIIDAGDKVFVAILQRGRPRGSQTVVEVVGGWCIRFAAGSICGKPRMSWLSERASLNTTERHPRPRGTRSRNH